MPQPMKCAQGHRWESGIGRQGQVPQMIPCCPMCGGQPVKRYPQWHELSWPMRLVAFAMLAVVPCAVLGLWYHVHLQGLFVRATFSGHGKAVNCVAFAPNGHQVVSGSEDQTARIWQADSGAGEATLAGNDGGVTAVAFAADGRTVATGGRDGTTRLWNAVSGKPTAVIQGTQPQAVIAFAPVGDTLAIAGKDHRIIIWDRVLGLPRASLAGHGGRITCLAYAPDGETLASAGTDGRLRLWAVGRYKGPGFRLSVDVTSGTIGPWSRPRPQPKAQLVQREAPFFASIEVPPPAIAALVFGSDNRTLIAGTGDGTLMVWDAVTGRKQEIWKGHDSAVIAVGFAPATGMVVTASATDVQLWDLTGGHLKARSCCDDFSGHITALAVSSDGMELAVARDKPTVEVWNVAHLLKYPPRE